MTVDHPARHIPSIVGTALRDGVRRVRAEGGLGASLAWAGLVILIVTLPSVPHWDAVIGNPIGETDNHLWMFWRASQRLIGRVGPLGNAPAGIDVPLMDPVNLPPYLLGAWLSPAAGWRLMATWNVGLAMLGGYLLARQWTSTDGARVAMVACGVTPFLGGMLDFGITESWPLGWFSLHTAALVAYGRRGRKIWAFSAGLALGAIALSGWYHAFYGLLWEALLVPVLLIRWRRPGLVAQGGIGAVMALPSLWAFLSVRSHWEPRWRIPSPGPPGPRPDWGELPVFGVDLLTYVLPHPEVVSPSKATYLGLSILLLVAIAVVREPRKALGLTALATPFLVLGLGYWPTVAGKAIGFSGPAKWIVEAIPALSGMSHWFRAVGPATVLLGVAAGLGAGVLCRRHAAWSHLLAAFVVFDCVYGAPTAWPKAAFRVEVPAAIETLAGRGAIIQLPFDNGRTEFSTEPPRIYQRWQVGHGRAIAENYEGVDALLAQSELVAPVDAACLVSSTLPPYYNPPPEMRGIGTPSKKNGLAMAQALADAGFEWIIVHRQRCPVTVTPIRALTKVLGPGIDLPGGDRAWPLVEALRAPTEDAVRKSRSENKQSPP